MVGLIVSDALERIENFYGERRAKRSNIPLINHIREGMEHLIEMGADEYVIGTQYSKMMKT